jgi:hypothetical protein
VETHQNRKIAAALAVILVLSLLVFLAPWSGARPDEVAVETAVGNGGAVRSESRSLAGGDGVDGAGEAESRARVEAATAEAEITAAAVPYEFEMELVARTIEDLPGAAVPIHLAPEFHVLNQTQTDSDGIARVKWRGRVSPMTMVYASPKGLVGGKRLYRCVVHAGTVARVALLVSLRPSWGRPFTVYGSGGLLKFDGIMVTPGKHRITGVTAITNSLAAPPLFKDKNGWAWFGTGRGGIPTEVVRDVVTTRYSQLVVSRFAINLIADRQKPPKVNRKRVLTGVIRDAAGRPIPSAMVLLSGRSRTRTNASGKYRIEFKKRDGDVLDLRAGGGDHGLAFRKIELDEATTLRWDAQLDRGIELRGQLVSTNGEPRAGWHVQIEPEDGSPWIDGTTTDKAGRFAIPNVEDRGYRVRAFAAGCVLSSFLQRDVRPFGSHVFAVWADGKRGKFQVAPRDLERKRMTDATFRFWDHRSGMGRRIVPRSGTSLVVAGDFRVVIDAAGFALANHASVRIDSDQLTDLGDVMLGERAYLDMSRVKKALTLYRLHDAVLSRVETVGKKIVRLPPGTYLAFDGAGEVRFEIKPGANAVPKSIRR